MRKRFMAEILGGLAIVLASVVAGTVSAGTIPYPNSGTPNSTTYTFTAAASGDLIGYFAGSGAGYDEEVGVLINGVQSAAGFGLDNHASALGDQFNFGHVNVGDSLIFDLRTNTLGGLIAYSDPSLNGPYDFDGSVGHNHVYSTDALADQAYVGSPAGTYVAFEDLQFPGSDFNYFDNTFVFLISGATGPGGGISTNSVPEPSSLALLGFGAIGVLAAYRRRKSHEMA